MLGLVERTVVELTSFSSEAVKGGNCVATPMLTVTQLPSAGATSGRFSDATPATTRSEISSASSCMRLTKMAMIFSAITGDELARTAGERAAHFSRYMPEAFVASLVAVAIVVELEVIDVDHRDAERLPCRYRVAPGLASTHFERVAVHQLRAPVATHVKKS